MSSDPMPQRSGLRPFVGATLNEMMDRVFPRKLYMTTDVPIQCIQGGLVIIRFLRTRNAELSNTRLVSFLIDGVLAVDAGSLVSELRFLQSEVSAISRAKVSHFR